MRGGPLQIQRPIGVELEEVRDLGAGEGKWQSPETWFPGIDALMSDLRGHLSSDNQRFTTDIPLPVDATAKCQLYVTLFQAGLAPLRWGTTVDTLSASLDRISRRLREHDSFRKFAVENGSRTKILIEYITSAEPVPSVELVTEDRLVKYRFEPGITGMAFRAHGKSIFYMPTEAFTRSHMTLQQTFQYLARRMGIRSSSTAECIRLAKAQMSAVNLITSRAYLSADEEVFELYRGYPKRSKPSTKEIKDSLLASVAWVLRNQFTSGKFLYYYDASTGSTKDFQHPKNPGYYNMLRHSGGTITLLRAYELTGEERYVEAARNSLVYLLHHSRIDERDGRICRFVMDNGKAKLVGTGVGLVALMHYYRLTGESRFLEECGEMANHLLSQIDSEGEFLGYYIHPLFNGGRPLLNVSDEEKRKLFSFYYPGEALLGLALYEKYAPITDSRRAEIRAAGRTALDFLVHIRAKRYPDLFLSLPADGWLMQAIEEWWSDPEMRDPSYLEFVVGDAEKITANMYNELNSPYPDYVGNFFYWHGQHALPDGARAEGLIAAYILARNAGIHALAEKILGSCKMAAAGLMHTFNTPESTYAAADPEKAVGAFRFKLTRQWVRVDSIQHTACFFARLLPHLEDRSR